MPRIVIWEVNKILLINIKYGKQKTNLYNTHISTHSMATVFLILLLLQLQKFLLFLFQKHIFKSK